MKPTTIEQVLNMVYWYGFLEGRDETVASKDEAMSESDALAAIEQLVLERVIGKSRATYQNGTGISDAHRGQVGIAITDLMRNVASVRDIRREDVDWFVGVVLKEIPQGLEDAGAYKLQAKQRQALKQLMGGSGKQPYKNVTRLEVIDSTGRAYVNGAPYGDPVSVELNYQDEGRTLKVFVNEGGDK